MKRLWSWCAIVLLMASNTAQANTVDTMLQSGELQISATIAPGQPFVATQEITVWLDIKTRTWFAGGSRIQLPELANTVVMQNQDFAINSSERRGADTLAVQRWAISLYPQQAGLLNIPPVGVTVAIAHPEAGTVRGTIYSQPLSVEVVWPPTERGNEGWLASPDFRVKRSYEAGDFSGQAGESLQLEVTTTAEHLLPMMLPPAQLATIKGLAIYRQLPQLKHNTQRGENTAIRRDVFDIVVEQAGNYQLPAQHYRWWNTKTAQMETISLPGLAIVSGQGVSVIEIEAAENGINTWLYTVLGSILLGCVAAYFLSRVRGQAASRWQCQLRVNRALKQGNAQRAVQYLYECLGEDAQLTNLREYAKALGDERFSQELNALLAAAYGLGATAPRGLKLPRQRFVSARRGRLPRNELYLNP